MNLESLDKKMDDFFNSKEGQDSIDEFHDQIVRERKWKKRQLKKFAKLTKEQRHAFIDKVLERYTKDDYINRWYKKGYEPEEMLKWLLHDYFEKKGVRKVKGKYISPFNNDFFVLDNKYASRILLGQGAAVQIFKL